MIGIIDNGKGADKISQLVKGKKTVVTPEKAKTLENFSAVILSDGNIKNEKANLKLLETAAGPVLGIGAGAMFIGTAFGSTYKEVKPEKQKMLRLVKPGPIVRDLKKTFKVACECGYAFNEITENFGVVASSPKNEFEILQDMETPFFCVSFNPELGFDGITIIKNFQTFVEVWKKYNK